MQVEKKLELIVTKTFQITKKWISKATEDHVRVQRNILSHLSVPAA